MDWILRHKTISIVIVVLVAAAAWYMLSGTSSDNAVLTSETAAAAPAGAQDLVDSLLALRAVTLAGTIFSNPAFQALRDLTTPITPEPAGRANPFAPLGSDASAAAAKNAQPSAPR